MPEASLRKAVDIAVSALVVRRANGKAASELVATPKRSEAQATLTSGWSGYQEEYVFWNDEDQ